ncbi:hypothetical protein RND81_11G172200 [Saponaria officinalis]|uniref:Uncharacterized protein n=1 Tax=Saponaria officinalis TaxID=3572 RepID=A0AAW1HN64_SAPOF
MGYIKRGEIRVCLKRDDSASLRSLVNCGLCEVGLGDCGLVKVDIFLGGFKISLIFVVTQKRGIKYLLSCTTLFFFFFSSKLSGLDQFLELDWSGLNSSLIN